MTAARLTDNDERVRGFADAHVSRPSSTAFHVVDKFTCIHTLASGSSRCCTDRLQAAPKLPSPDRSEAIVHTHGAHAILSSVIRKRRAAASSQRKSGRTACVTRRRQRAYQALCSRLLSPASRSLLLIPLYFFGEAGSAPKAKVGTEPDRPRRFLCTFPIPRRIAWAHGLS